MATSTRIDNGKVYTPRPLALLAADRLKWAADVAQLSKPLSVVDPCCGDGNLLRPFGREPSGFSYQGYDIDRVAIARASLLGLDCELKDVFDNSEPCDSTVVCNPPYVGCSNLSRIVGKDRFDWLKKTYKAERSGSCDLAGYVLRHVLERWRPSVSTWIVTNTIAQGGTRRVGLRWAIANGYKIVSALKDIQWPGQAAVIVHIVTMVDTQAVAWNGEVEYEPSYQL